MIDNLLLNKSRLPVIILMVIMHFSSDRRLVSVTVNPTPAVEPAPAVRKAITTCRSTTTLAAKVSAHQLCLIQHLRCSVSLQTNALGCGHLVFTFLCDVFRLPV